QLCYEKGGSLLAWPARIVRERAASRHSAAPDHPCVAWLCVVRSTALNRPLPAARLGRMLGRPGCCCVRARAGPAATFRAMVEKPGAPGGGARGVGRLAPVILQGQGAAASHG